MRYGEFYDEHLRCRVRQVSKTRARRLYEDGKTIYMLACKMRYNNVWQSPCPMNKKLRAWENHTFDTIVNEFTFYNCDNERGKYPCFFVKVEDFK